MAGKLTPESDSVLNHSATVVKLFYINKSSRLLAQEMLLYNLSTVGRDIKTFRTRDLCYQTSFRARNELSVINAVIRDNRLALFI